MALVHDFETTLPQVLTLVRRLPLDQQSLLILALRYHPDAALPTTATLQEAMAFVLADACSLSRAAELAGVTRWDILDALHAHGIPLAVEGSFTVDEMDDLEARLERQGLL